MITGDIKTFEITATTAPFLAQRIEAIEDACKLAKTALKIAIRAGVVCEAEGKRYMPTFAKGKKMPDIDAMKATGTEILYKVGEDGERWIWKKVKS